MNAEMRDLLARASVVSEVSAARIDPNKTGHQKPSDMPPGGSNLSLSDRMARRFSVCLTLSDERRALAWARAELRRASRSRAQPLNTRQQEYWAVMAGQGRDYRDVASSTGLNEKTVWKLRSEAGFEPRKGLPKVENHAA